MIQTTAIPKEGSVGYTCMHFLRGGLTMGLSQAHRHTSTQKHRHVHLHHTTTPHDNAPATTLHRRTAHTFTHVTCAHTRPVSGHNSHDTRPHMNMSVLAPQIIKTHPLVCMFKQYCTRFVFLCVCVCVCFIRFRVWERMIKLSNPRAVHQSRLCAQRYD